MKIRGNTVGTTIAPKKVLVKSENLTEEEKAQARANIGAVSGTATIIDGVLVVGTAVDGGSVTMLENLQEQITQNSENLADIGQEVDSLKNAETPTASANYKSLYGRVEVAADDITAAGDEGITYLTIGSDNVDLTNYNEFAIKIYVPASSELNSTVGLLSIRCTNNSTFTTTGYGLLLATQSIGISTVCGIDQAAINHFVVKANFVNDDFIYGEIIKNGYANAYGYAGAQNGWTSIPVNFLKSEKKYFHIHSYGNKFKFPAGSYVEVYAR